MAKIRERERSGRYTHTWDHAGFDSDGREWGVCFDCGKYRNPDGKLVSEAPFLVDEIH